MKLAVLGGLALVVLAAAVVGLGLPDAIDWPRREQRVPETQHEGASDGRDHAAGSQQDDLAGWSPTRPTPKAAPAAARPLVEYAGCQEVSAAGACLLLDSPAQITLWVGAPPDAARVRPSAHLSVQTIRRVQRGQQFELKVKPGATAVEIDIDSEVSWRLPILWGSKHPALAAATNADRPRNERKAALQALIDQPPEPRVLVGALVALARLEPSASIALRERAAKVAADHGFASTAARQHLALTFGQLYRQRDLAAAEFHFQVSGRASDPETRAHRDYYAGLLARERGAVAEAQRRLQQAQDAAERLNLMSSHRAAKQLRATLLGSVGKFDEARQIYAQLVAENEEQPPCRNAELLTSYAWLDIQARESQLASNEHAAGAPLQLGEASKRLADAWATYERQECSDEGAKRANLLVNQALVAYHQGQVEAAEEILAAVKKDRRELSVHVEFWRLELSARISRLRGNYLFSAQEYARLLELAERTLAPEPAWRARLGLAQLAESRGDTPVAIEWLKRAEASLEDELMKLPIGEGRGTFSRVREQSARLLVQLLSEVSPGQALAVARAARVRTLSELARLDQVDSLGAAQRHAFHQALAEFKQARSAIEKLESEAWQAPAASELGPQRTDLQARARRSLSAALTVLSARRDVQLSSRAADEGELTLGFFPSADGWIGFANWNAAGKSLKVRSLGAPPSALRQVNEATVAHDSKAMAAELGAWLLEPFAKQIRAARSLRLVTHGELSKVDVHALALEGRPLLQQLAVSYGLDVEAATENHAVQRGILLVADPLGDLPSARDEADALLALWGDRREAVTSLRGVDATRKRLLQHLPNAKLFHYTGHGRQDRNDELAGQLLLADGSSLTSSDVLSLSRAPAQVVLSACDAAATQPRSNLQVGLAHAFLLRGTTGVVAASRPVGDQLAQRLSQLLHALPKLDAQSLRRAQLALAESQPGQDWAAFRWLSH